MTAETLRKYQTYLYDEQGKPVMVQLDLRNARMKQAYQKIMQELDAAATFEMIDKVNNDPNNEWSDFFDVADRILADKKAAHV